MSPDRPEGPPDEPGKRIRTDPWGGASLDESKAWRKLPTSGGSSSLGPAEFHGRAAGLLRSRGYAVEEETPDRDSAERGPARIEGAAQGEWHIERDTSTGRTMRRVSIGLMLAALVCLVVGAYGISRNSTDLALVLQGTLYFGVVGFALYPRPRFQSDIVWVGYDSVGPAGPTEFHVRAAHVWSGNSPRPSRYVASRTLVRLADRPDLDDLRARIAEQLLEAAPLR